MDIRICQDCGKEVDRSDMLYTKDCHNIPFGLVCNKCYNKLMENGYDGEYYTEEEECIEYDY